MKTRFHKGSTFPNLDRPLIKPPPCGHLALPDIGMAGLRGVMYCARGSAQRSNSGLCVGGGATSGCVVLRYTGLKNMPHATALRVWKKAISHRRCNGCDLKSPWRPPVATSPWRLSIFLWRPHVAIRPFSISNL